MRQIAKFCNYNNNRFNVFCIIFEQEYINTIKVSMNKLLKEKKYQNNKLINNNRYFNNEGKIYRNERERKRNQNKILSNTII